jgi:hypothetical protein
MDETLSIKEILDAHNSLPNHNELCAKKCLLELLQSREETRTDNQLPHSHNRQNPIRVEEGEIIKFD